MSRLFGRTGWLAAAALPALFVAEGASAVLVTEWSYDAQSAFMDYAPDSDAPGAVTGTEPNPERGGEPTTLSWGLGENQSSIAIEPSVEGTVQTNGDFAESATFTHNNFPIRDPNDVSLESFILSTNLRLVATQPGELVGSEQNLMLDFPSLFFESPNVSECGFPSASNCDDIFVLTDEEIGQTNGVFTTSTTFDLDDITYTVLLEIAGLSGLTDDQCSAAGASTGCVGFLTQEGQANQFTSRFRITAQDEPAEVPEPGTLGLLGLGLLGLGLAGHRRVRRD